jgi:hypothetical protein
MIGGCWETFFMGGAGRREVWPKSFCGTGGRASHCVTAKLAVPLFGHVFRILACHKSMPFFLNCVVNREDPGAHSARRINKTGNFSGKMA